MTLRGPLTALAIFAGLVGSAAGSARAQGVGTPDPAKAANTGDPAKLALERLRLSIQRTTLKNGLRVVLQPDNGSPTVAIAVTYDVGARNEQPGRSGFAHLFEHMMFQGSRHVAKGEHFKLVSARGGTLNGTTSSDRTNYFEALPANELALGLWLEADRMKWLDVTKENFDNQRKVVQEEYRMRVENAAYVRGALRLDELAFQGYFPYEHSAIGSMADLEAARFAWVDAFHESFYAPNTAVLSIVGDFDPDQAIELVHRYFDDAKAQPNVPAYAPPALPVQKNERAATVEDRHAKTPGLYYGWPIPASRTPEHYALELAALLLADGESSRLYQKLVRQRAIARTVSAWTSGHRGPDLFAIMVTATAKTDLKTIRRELDAELRRLAQTAPSEAELQKTKNRMRSRFVFGLESNLSRATRLGEFELFWGDARLITRELDAYFAVTPDAVKRAVAAHLVAERRSVVEVAPGQVAKPAAALPPLKPPAPAPPPTKPGAEP
jgi:zinc protease